MSLIKIFQAYKYELDPTNSQKILLDKSAGTARFAWNWALAKRIELFNSCETKERFTNAQKQHKELVVLKQTEFNWMYEISKCTVQNSLRDLDKAFSKFWKNRKLGQGFPKFKKKNQTNSFRLDSWIKLENKSIKLPKLGRIKLKEKTDKFYKFNPKILSATVSKEANKWFVSICVEVERPEPIPVIGDKVGIDLGLTNFVTLSDGTKIEAPKPLKQNLKKLRKLSKQHSKKKKGSNNKEKSRQKLEKLNYKIKCIRKDFINKLTTKLVKTKSVIIIENLQIKEMMKNKTLSRAISDVGWGEFKRQLEYKSKWYGSKLIIVDKFFPSSKMCSNCGCIKDKLNLSERVFNCEFCKFTIDRDLNAAINLKNYYLKQNTEGFSEIKACSGLKSEFDVKSNRESMLLNTSMKQEIVNTLKQ